MTEHLITTPAQLESCHRCGHRTLTALAGGLEIHADPQPLGINAEIAALLCGRLSYDVLISATGRVFFEWRHTDRIRATSHHVVATHTCRAPPIKPQPPEPLILAPPSVQLPAIPPY